MRSFTLSHLLDHDVQKGLLAAVPVERTATAAAGRSKVEIEYLLAARSPKPGAKAAVLTKSASSQEKEHAPGHVESDPGLETGAEGAARRLAPRYAAK